MKIYTIIGGVNGVGKSSLSGVLKSRTTDLGLIIDVDKITASLCLGMVEGGKTAIRMIDKCISEGVNFTQETTLSSHQVLSTIKRARDEGYYIRLYYIGLNSLEESKRRIDNRVARGGHNIPEEDIERRFESRWDSVKRILPFCNEAAFYDNDNGFVEVAAFRNGELILEGDYRPLWLAELQTALKP